MEGVARHSVSAFRHAGFVPSPGPLSRRFHGSAAAPRRPGGGYGEGSGATSSAARTGIATPAAGERVDQPPARAGELGPPGEVGVRTPSGCTPQSTPEGLRALAHDQVDGPPPRPGTPGRTVQPSRRSSAASSPGPPGRHRPRGRRLRRLVRRTRGSRPGGRPPVASEREHDHRCRARVIITLNRCGSATNRRRPARVAVGQAERDDHHVGLAALERVHRADPQPERARSRSTGKRRQQGRLQRVGLGPERRDHPDVRRPAAASRRTTSTDRGDLGGVDARRPRTPSAPGRTSIASAPRRSRGCRVSDCDPAVVEAPRRRSRSGAARCGGARPARSPGRPRRPGRRC